MPYEMVIGLETHVELSTQSKIFCSCTTAFGGEPNTHCCPVCVGHPGTLPRLNKQAVEFAVLAGLATGCTIAGLSKMDRKNYVYPDLPKAYQISQFDRPLCTGGALTLQNGRVVRINRIHLEEDAGKLIHEGGSVFVDYNRGGVPLIEIVTEPDLRSADEVREYLEEIQRITRYLGISDARMQEGSLRCDVNISLRPAGSAGYGTRTEIKNMNSFAFIVKAIVAESERQADIYASGGVIRQETLRFNEQTGLTESMRGKEDSQDYRYFPEPDLIPILVPPEQLEALRASLPELPAAKRERYVGLGLTPQEAALLTKYYKMAQYFEALLAGGASPKAACSLLLGPVFQHLGTEEQKEQADLPNPAYLAELLQLKGTLPPALQKNLAERILQKRLPLSQVAAPEELTGADTGEITALAIQAVKDNPQAAADYLAGKEKAFKALLGAVMRAARGRADPQAAEQALLEQLQKLR